MFSFGGDESGGLRAGSNLIFTGHGSLPSSGQAAARYTGKRSKKLLHVTCRLDHHLVIVLCWVQHSVPLSRPFNLPQLGSDHPQTTPGPVFKHVQHFEVIIVNNPDECSRKKYDSNVYGSKHRAVCCGTKP